MKPTLLPLLIVISTFFLPVVPLVASVALFVVADTVFGIITAIKNKQKITSFKLAAVVYKLLIYEALLLLGFFVDNFILGELFAIWTDIPLVATKSLAMLVISIEGFSIDEKIRAMNNNKGLRHYLKKAWKTLMEGKQMFDKLKDS